MMFIWLDEISKDKYTRKGWVVRQVLIVFSSSEKFTECMQRTVCVQGGSPYRELLSSYTSFQPNFKVKTPASYRQPGCKRHVSDRVIRVSNSCRHESFFKATLNYQERSTARRVPAQRKKSYCF